MKQLRRIGRFLCLLALAWIFISLPLRAAASGTATLTIQIPATHTVALHLHGRGTVKIEDATYSRSCTVSAERLSSPELVIAPGVGRYIRAIYLDGTLLNNSGTGHTLTIHSITEDHLLEVYFESSDTTNPSTGDKIILPLSILILSGAALTTLSKRKKQ